MNQDLPKQYLKLLGSTVLDITLTKILSITGLAGLVLALREDDPHWPHSHFAKDPRVHCCAGGEERSDSVFNALQKIRKLSCGSMARSWVLVHDAARPCVAPARIRDLIQTCQARNSGALLAAPVADTIKRASSDMEVTATEDRQQLWQAHTPQMFPFEQLQAALVFCREQRLAVTDEASAVEGIGGRVLLVADRRDNIKITLPEDLAWAEHILQQQRKADTGL